MQKYFYFLALNFVIIEAVLLNRAYLGFVSSFSLLGSLVLAFILIICLAVVIFSSDKVHSRNLLIYSIILGVWLSGVSFYTASNIFDKADVNIEVTDFDRLLSAFSTIYAMLIPMFGFLWSRKKSFEKNMV